MGLFTVTVECNQPQDDQHFYQQQDDQHYQKREHGVHFVSSIPPPSSKDSSAQPTVECNHQDQQNQQPVQATECGTHLSSQHNKPKMGKYSKPSRIYPFCFKNQGEKLSRHITKVHMNEDRVKEALKLPKKERDAALAQLKKEGILFANRQQLKEENPQNQSERKCSKPLDLTICAVCKGFYA
jgi:hypothetical protein